MVATAPPRRRAAEAWPRELALLAALYVAYRQLRGAAPERAADAHANASAVLDATPGPVLRWEHRMVDLAQAHPGVEALLRLLYDGLHLPVTAAVLLWLWRRRDGGYVEARRVLVLLTAASLVVFWLVPVAPPRLVLGTAAAEARLLAPAWVNDYAALPSLHVAWACWCAWVVAGRSGRAARRLAWCYPVLTAVVTVSTANHYTIDLLAGAAVFGASAPAVRWVGGWSARRSAAEDARGVELGAERVRRVVVGVDAEHL